jgi:hypothetical protein
MARSATYFNPKNFSAQLAMIQSGSGVGTPLKFSAALEIPEKNARGKPLGLPVI